MSILVGACAVTPTIKPKTKNKRISYKIKKDCAEHVKYYRLLSKLTKQKKQYRYFLKSSIEKLCAEQYKTTMNLMRIHNNKIGIIFENTNDTKDKDKAIFEGLLKSAEKFKTKNKFIVRKVKLNNKSINKALSDLVLKKKVGIIITWGKPLLMQRIQKWQKGLRVPTLFIDNKVKRSRDSFRVYPNRKNYGNVLTKSLKTRNIKKIAILTPLHSENSTFLKEIKKKMRKQGITIVHDVVYDPAIYGSMDFACRKIFNINRENRRHEYSEILRTERAKAEGQGYKLNWNSVFLPAEVSYDAIFIPDNFKIVHHFVKLFQYYQAPRIPLIGNHEWRSSELLSSDTDYLSGSWFIDFVSRAKDLPIFESDSSKSLPLSHSLGVGVDYKLMGYYTGYLGQLAVKRSKFYRTRVSEKLNSIKIKDNFLKNKIAFKKHEFNWPSFSFEVLDNEIVIEEKKLSGKRENEALHIK